jgi:hypothetical protein
VVPPVTAQPASTPARPAAPPSAVNCSPPYFFDRDGNRVFKRECL